MFDFGVISQVLLTQQTMTVNNRFRRSHSVDNIMWSDAKVEKEAVLIYERIII